MLTVVRRYLVVTAPGGSYDEPGQQIPVAIRQANV
jgi:hypothetical protein